MPKFSITIESTNMPITENEMAVLSQETLDQVDQAKASGKNITGEKINIYIDGIDLDESPMVKAMGILLQDTLKAARKDPRLLKSIIRNQLELECNCEKCKARRSETATATH
jgi:hypothetical protein